MHKRKSEVDKELSSPGKRVRGMSETTASNASMILHSQSYINHNNSVAAAGAMCSPSSSHYGHFQVSPHTPSRSVLKGQSALTSYEVEYHSNLSDFTVHIDRPNRFCFNHEIVPIFTFANSQTLQLINNKS